VTLCGELTLETPVIACAFREMLTPVTILRLYTQPVETKSETFTLEETLSPQTCLDMKEYLMLQEGLFCSVLSCSVLFCPVLSCSLLFCSVLFCSLLFCSVLSCSLLFSSVLFSSVPFSSVLSCSVLFCYHFIVISLCNYWCSFVLTHFWLVRMGRKHMENRLCSTS
jgi:antibiotic biosynthesis monooxygenase (ABM) superfamily enzyme